MRHILTFGAVAMLAVACGGTSSIGRGNGAQDGSGGSGASGGDGSQGGSGTAGDPGKGGGGGIGQGGVAGGGGAIGVECKGPADCITPGTCRACPDGSQICDKVDCFNGQCVMLDIYQLCPGEGTCDPTQCGSYYNGKGCCLPTGAGCGLDYGKGCEPVPAKCDPATCPADPNANSTPCCMPDGFSCGVSYGAGCGPIAGECKMDSDCPVPPPFCQLCNDGSCAPAFTSCIGGKCSTNLGECPGQPHWAKTCGDPVCSSGPPGNPTGIPACDPALGQKETGPCDKSGELCDPGYGCGVMLQCTTASGPLVCPL